MKTQYVHFFFLKLPFEVRLVYKTIRICEFQRHSVVTPYSVPESVFPCSVLSVSGLVFTEYCLFQFVSLYVVYE